MNPDAWAAISSVANVIVAAGASLIAFFAWRTSAAAAAATTMLTRLEKKRLHGERTPSFDLSTQRIGAGWKEGSAFEVHIAFVGPPTVHRLACINLRLSPVRVRKWESNEEVEYHPWTFEEQLTEVDLSPMQLGESVYFILHPGNVPSALLKSNLPLHLTLTCRADDDEPWTLPMALRLPQPRKSVLPENLRPSHRPQ